MVVSRGPGRRNNLLRRAKAISKNIAVANDVESEVSTVISGGLGHGGQKNKPRTVKGTPSSTVSVEENSIFSFAASLFGIFLSRNFATAAQNFFFTLLSWSLMD
jgi:hypothetical protein